MTKKNFYAVVKGRKPGIYTEWAGSNGAEVQVKGFVGAIYKGFAFRHEAEKWLADHRQAKVQPAEFRPTTTAKKSLREETLPQNSYAITPARKPVIEENGTQASITIYTDGGCSHNPGPGGYGVVILYPDGQRKELSGGYAYTTNNRMELMACIVALESLTEPGDVILYSDSSYVVNGMTRNWAKTWRRNGWMRSATESALNPDLWGKLLNLCAKRKVEFRWLKGHAGHKENERCDQLTHEARGCKDLPVDEGYQAVFIPFEKPLHGVFVPPIEQARGLFPGINTDVEREEDDRA